MVILHYGLGFPPYRSGGLTKFTLDLMKRQRKLGHEVALLWPGRYSLFYKKTIIRFDGEKYGVKSYEIINPNPVSYDEGIVNNAPFMATGSISTYKDFLIKIRPDVIHVETLMGIQKGLIEVAKELGIRLVFTTHDFFPICPKVTLYRNDGVCDSVYTCENCAECNRTALSLNKIRLLQSPLYRKLKNCKIIRVLRKKHRKSFAEKSEINFVSNKVGSSHDYFELRNYYFNILFKMDIIHFNSNITKKVYESYIGDRNSAVFQISHEDIVDRRKKKFFSDTIRFSYLGAYSGAKGFFFLKKCLDQLWSDGYKNFTLNVYFEMPKAPDYLIQHRRYEYNELSQVFNETDALIVPSIWYETFGYTVAEALSFGVPIIVSSHVGAKDIIPKGGGMIYEAQDQRELYNIIRNVKKEKLEEMNSVICEEKTFIDIEQMAKWINKELYNFKLE